MNYFIIGISTPILDPNNQGLIEKNFDISIYIEDYYPSRATVVKFFIEKMSEKIDIEEQEVSITFITRITQREYDLWNDILEQP